MQTPAEIERAVRQRAYDDGYEDGRLDVNVEYEREIKERKLEIGAMSLRIDSLRADNQRLKEVVILNLQNAVNENADLVVELREALAWEHNCACTHEADDNPEEYARTRRLLGLPL
jgi:hypothetical protein